MLAGLYTDALETAVIPDSWLKLSAVPLNKPAKGPLVCENKWPISLINSPVKILEAIVLNRIQPSLEPGLPPAQYAYRRARGAEFQSMGIFLFCAPGTGMDCRYTLQALISRGNRHGATSTADGDDQSDGRGPLSGTFYWTAVARKALLSQVGQSQWATL